MIILPSKRIIEPRDALVARTGVSGHYTMTVHKPDGRSRVVASFPNLVTNFGLNQMATLGALTYLSFCRVGSGSTAPAFANTALVTQVASTNTNQATASGASASAPYYGFFQITKRFAAGVAAGNLSEVGMGQTASGADLFSRALILDGGGSPTTITILSDEVLDVTYELRWYAPSADVTGSVVIGGVSYNYTIRASLVTSGGSWSPIVSTPNPSGSSQIVYNGAIGAVTGNPSGATGQAGSVSLASYSANSQQRDQTINFGLNDGNLAGGVTALRYFLLCTFQIGFSAAIPKDNTKVMSFVMRQSWVRH